MTNDENHLGNSICALQNSQKTITCKTQLSDTVLQLHRALKLSNVVVFAMNHVPYEVCVSSNQGVG
jgi:hypothetical protein